MIGRTHLDMLGIQEVMNRRMILKLVFSIPTTFCVLLDFFWKQQNDKQTKDVKVRVGGKREKFMLCQMNILLSQNVFHK